MRKIRVHSLGAEKIVVLLILLMSTSAIVPLVQNEYGTMFDTVKGDKFSQTMWAIFYLWTLIMLFPRIKTALKTIKKNQFLWFLIALAIISIIWSDFPAVTFRRIVALLGTTLVGIYLTVRFSYHEIIRLFFWTFCLSAVLSIAFAIISPSLGIHYDTDHMGAWRGIYIHKNILGRLMALASIYTLILLIGKQKKFHITSISLGLFLILLALSTSKTALIIFFVLLFLIPFYKIIHLHPLVVIPLTILLFLGSAWVTTWLTNNLDSILLFLGRDTTLTGRTQLWQAVWVMIKNKFWLGYGYSAFWVGLQGQSSFILENIQWGAAHAHNGFLDLWLELGLSGVVLFCFSLIINIVKSILLVRKESSFISTLPLVFFVFFIMTNITESTILVQNSIYWIMYVAFSTFLNLQPGCMKNNCVFVKRSSEGNEDSYCP